MAQRTFATCSHPGGALLRSRCATRINPSSFTHPPLPLNASSRPGFAVFKGVGRSLATAWGLVCTFHLFIGGAMANVALPCTRIYEPLQVRDGAVYVYI